MKGWPLLRAALAWLILLLAGLPLHFLTAAKKPVIAPARMGPVLEKITVSLTFTQLPEKFSVKFQGQEILLEGDAPAFDSQASWNAHFPSEGIDLIVDAVWPEHFRKAGVRVQVTRADGTSQNQTLWGRKEIYEVLTFPGKAGR